MNIKLFNICLYSNWNDLFKCEIIHPNHNYNNK